MCRHRLDLWERVLLIKGLLVAAGDQNSFRGGV